MAPYNVYLQEVLGIGLLQRNKSLYICFDNISFKIEPLGNDTILTTFVKLLETILETIF
jgi:hypothetical protein